MTPTLSIIRSFIITNQANHINILIKIISKIRKTAFIIPVGQIWEFRKLRGSMILLPIETSLREPTACKGIIGSKLSLIILRSLKKITNLVKVFQTFEGKLIKMLMFLKKRGSNQRKIHLPPKFKASIRLELSIKGHLYLNNR